MRSSVLFASALAVGALASPLEKRVMVTEVDLDVVTVTVFVTPGQAIPTADTDGHEYGHGHGHHSKHKSSSTSSTSSSSSPAPAPSQPAPEPSSVYTPPPPASHPTPTPAPTSAPAPSSSAAYTPAPEPSTAASSSQAPVSSSSPSYGVEHVSGDVQATFSSGADYQNALLWHHNRARANHGASNLEWSDDCASAAKTAAEYCDFTHHVVDGQGQNLFTLSGDAYNVTAGVTESWYKGEADIYQWWGQEPPHNATAPDQLDMDWFEKYGHATQVLWKGTKSMGCYTVDCGSKMTVGGKSSDMSKYTVCNYSPPGNYINEFGDNVASAAGSWSGYHWSD